MYPGAIEDHVPPPLLQRYFTREGGHYKVRKALRDIVLFTAHNLLHDPAFSRIDLITCRNFLIYLNPEMQRHVLQQFHFALNPGGVLMLGAAETAETVAHLFEPLDAARRIYRARPVARRPAPVRRPAAAPPAAPEPPPVGRRSRLYSFAEIHLNKVAELAPPSILVNADGDIVHVSESAARFLRPAGGEPTRELVALLPPALQLPLRAALLQARKDGRETRTGPVRAGLRGTAPLDLLVLPFRDPHAEDGLMLVGFHETRDAEPAPAAPADEALARQLDQELRQVRRQLHEAVQHAEQSAGEMRVYGEEMQASMEELRAHADEADRARERLAVRNLALEADNGMLARRAQDAAKAHDDLANLVASSDVATLFLDRAMRIVRYTPRVADFFNVIPADIGRPLAHITNSVGQPGLAADAALVLETLQAIEREVRAKDGRDYLVRVHPYRTTTHRIEGAVMSFFDISSRRAAEAALRASEERFRLFLTASSDMLYRMSADWSEMFSLEGRSALRDTRDPSRTWIDDYIPADEQPLVRATVARAIATRGIFALEHRVIHADGSIGWTVSRAVPLLDADGAIVEWFGAASDITQRKRDEQARQTAEARLAALFDSLPVGAGIVERDGGISLCNKALQRFLPTNRMPSRDPERVARWRAWDADGNRVEPENFPGARALRGERVLPGIEMLYTDDTGRETWTQVAAVPVTGAGGGVIGQGVTVTDIDALKRSEEALRENEGRLRELAAEFAQMVWETGPDGMVDTDSPSWRACTGQTLAEWQGTGWLDVVHPDDRAYAARQWSEAVAAHGMVNAQFRIRRADGRWQPMKVRAAPLLGADGRIRKWVGLNVEVDG